jgi:glycosyltransferase involved in cell wall biosynthesis
VLPSRSEAFPNALIEAMATALPVVATDVGGIPEIVRPGVNGRLVPADDPGALAEAVVALMDDPAGAHALGRTARADVERHYTLDRMVERFEQLYLAEIETHVWNRGNRRHSRAAA